jgi:RNA polymerase sigma factor (sigma-70 family)
MSNDLDDVAQEVFLRLLRYQHDEIVVDPRAYLFKIAGNVASEWSCRARERLPHDSDWLDDLPDDSDVTREMERNQRSAEITIALNRLPARAREILRLHFGEGLGQSDIAARLGVTRRIVKRDIVRSYAALRLTLAASKAKVSIPDPMSIVGSET